jgi:ACS family D-galactonate transporter-like MFS transporter
METSKPVEGRRAAGPSSLLALGLLISFVDRTSLSSALADKGFVREFALTKRRSRLAQLGLLLVLRPVADADGLVVDRYGVKWPYTICFALWCLATALTGAGDHAVGLIVMRLIIGVAEAVVMPASYRWIRNNFDESQSGLAVGIFSMGNKFGPALGAPVAAWLIVNYSWQCDVRRHRPGRPAVAAALGCSGAQRLPVAKELATAKRKASVGPFATCCPARWSGAA